MKEELQKHIDEVKKLADLLPTNTKANRKKKEEFLLEELNSNADNASLTFDTSKSDPFLNHVENKLL